MKHRAVVVAIIVSLAPWALAADQRQGLSTGASRVAQAAEERTPEPAPPPQPVQPPPFAPIPPGGPTSPQSPAGPPVPADPTGERGVAMLHQLVGQQEAGSRDLLARLNAEITKWAYEPDGTGGSFCLPPGWMAHYSPDRLVVRLTSPDGHASVERGFMGALQSGLKEPIAEEAVANLALQNYNLRRPDGRVMKEDTQVRRRPGSHLRLQGADVTKCRGAPPELRSGRDIPDAPRLQQRNEWEDEFLVRMLFRAIRAGDYTVAVFAESSTITYKVDTGSSGYTHYDTRTKRMVWVRTPGPTGSPPQSTPYHMTSYVAVIAPTKQYTQLTQEVFIPLLHLLWLSWGEASASQTPGTPQRPHVVR